MKVKGGQGQSSQQDQNKRAVAFERRAFLLDMTLKVSMQKVKSCVGVCRQESEWFRVRVYADIPVLLAGGTLMYQ